MRPRIATLMLAALFSVQPLAAQELAPPPSQGRPWVVGFSHYAKWGVLASAVAFTALSLRAHRDADRNFTALKEYCSHASEQCQVGPDGAYVGGDAEILWQATARADREARGWLVGGEASLIVSGGMFLLDLVSNNSRPKNIPFTPFQVYSQPRKLGLQISF